MKKGDKFYSKWWFWVILIVFLAIIGNAHTPKNTVNPIQEINKTDIPIKETNDMSSPTDMELEIYDYYDVVMAEEETKLYNEQEAIPYASYDDEYLQQRVEREIKEYDDMENRVLKEVADYFNITEKELDDILLKVTIYKYG